MQKLLPPVLLLLTLVFIAIANVFFPIVELMLWPFTLIGVPLMVFGIGLAVAGSRTFKRKNTNIHTFKKPDTLVTTGLFALSRNPMYLGFAIAAVGSAILAGTLMPWVFALVFCVILDRWYVRFEEKIMMQTFGNDYEDYKEKVRRWI